MKARRIDRDVLAVLSGSETRGAELALPGQLDRALYLKVNKVLEALGGKWNRKAKAHVFGGDAEELVDAVILSGEVALPEDFGFFPTPQPLAAALVARADVRHGMEVLEPSAGDGAIVREILAAGAVVDVVELQPKNFAKLDDLGAVRAGVVGDFLRLSPAEWPTRYDRVVMNPPFAKRADIAHVLHAMKFLKPGGRLVSVMSAGVVFREDRLTRNFREVVEARDGTIEALPEGSFKASGTDVNTVVVELRV